MPTPANATTNPTTSMPPAAAHVLHARSEPTAISAHTAGNDSRRIRARCGAGPGNFELPTPYRQP
ncbi:hypothetical protein AB0F49_12275 [Micromonospora ureilytica]